MSHVFTKKEWRAIRQAWNNMMYRCYNPKDKSYKNYGDRGIIVCDRWRESVHNFIQDMGPRPSELHSIERVNNEGNYTPENCVWGTQKQQARNRRRFLTLTHNSKTQTIIEWSQETGISYAILYSRLSRGLPSEKILRI